MMMFRRKRPVFAFLLLIPIRHGHQQENYGKRQQDRPQRFLPHTGASLVKKPRQDKWYYRFSRANGRST